MCVCKGQSGASLSSVSPGEDSSQTKLRDYKRSFDQQKCFFFLLLFSLSCNIKVQQSFGGRTTTTTTSTTINKKIPSMLEPLSVNVLHWFSLHIGSGAAGQLSF